MTTATAQDDIAWFRLKDISGQFEVRYRLDENRNDAEHSNTFIKTPTLEEELLIRTRSYVYHPGLLNISIGGGPVLVQSEFESERGRSTDRDTLFNIDASLAFLSLRPYPFTLYYAQSHPQTSTGLSGSFVSTTENYGARGVFQPRKSRFRMFWEAAKREASGSGTGAVLDDATDSASIRLLLPYSEKNDLSMSVRRHETLSRSGNVGLPIQESNITYTNADISADNFFGDETQISFRQNLNWMRQDTLLAMETRVDRLNYIGSLFWDYDDRTNYFAKLRFVDVDRTETWSQSSGFNAGFRRNLNGRWSMSANGDLSRSESPSFLNDRVGANASLAYRRSLPFGRLSASARLGIRQTDQDSGVSSITIFDEPVLLVGTSEVGLAEDFVVPGSVVVTNEAKTQTYIEGLDYRLFEIGATTNIERLVGGNIADGQTVLVTYEAQTQGTVEFKSLDQRVSASLTTLKYATFYFSYSTLDNDVSSGAAITPLNDSNVFEIGTRVDYPLGTRWTVGGDYRYLDQESDILSYVGHRFDVYGKVRLSGNTTLRVGVQSNQVDNGETTEDLEYFGYTVGLSTILPGGMRLSYSGRYFEDTGGSLDKEEFRHGLRLDWGYRRVRFFLNADHTTSKQGANEQTYYRVNARLSRYF